MPETNEAEVAELPEITAAHRRKLKQCFDHANATLTEGKKQGKTDYDYVNTMLTECIVTDPGNLIYVEAFLDNLSAKFDNNRKGGRLGFNARGPVKKAIAKKEWLEVLKKGPDVLKANPWDVQTLRWMAEACAAFHLNEVELRYLKNALDANPKAIEVNKHCAQSLARMGQYEQAIACWHRIEALQKGNTEAPEMISKLSVERHRVASGLSEETSPEIQQKVKQAASSPSSKAPEPEPETKPEPKREIKLTERQQLEREVASDPSNVDPCFALADLHIREGRFQDAEQVLTKCLNAAGNDLTIREKLEDTMILRAKNQVAVADKRAKEKQTDEAKELASQVRDNLYRIELDILNARAQRFPEDLSYKYELGIRLKKLGNYDQAMEHLKEARGVQEHRTQATIEIGECLQHTKQYAKALQCYQKAVESAGRRNQSDLRKLALYRAGVLASGLKQADVARTHLEELLKLDSAYKDAQSRLDKIS